MHVLQDAKSCARYRYSLHIFGPLLSLISTGRAFAIGTVHTEAHGAGAHRLSTQLPVSLALADDTAAPVL